MESVTVCWAVQTARYNQEVIESRAVINRWGLSLISQRFKGVRHFIFVVLYAHLSVIGRASRRDNTGVSATDTT